MCEMDWIRHAHANTVLDLHHRVPEPHESFSYQGPQDARFEVTSTGPQVQWAGGARTAYLKHASPRPPSPRPPPSSRVRKISSVDSGDMAKVLAREELGKRKPQLSMRIGPPKSARFLLAAGLSRSRLESGAAICNVAGTRCGSAAKEAMDCQHVGSGNDVGPGDTIDMVDTQVADVGLRHDVWERPAVDPAPDAAPNGEDPSETSDAGSALEMRSYVAGPEQSTRAMTPMEIRGSACAETDMVGRQQSGGISRVHQGQEAMHNRARSAECQDAGYCCIQPAAPVTTIDERAHLRDDQKAEPTGGGVGSQGGLERAATATDARHTARGRARARHGAGKGSRGGVVIDLTGDDESGVSLERKPQSLLALPYTHGREVSSAPEDILKQPEVPKLAGAAPLRLLPAADTAVPSGREVDGNGGKMQDSSMQDSLVAGGTRMPPATKAWYDGETPAARCAHEAQLKRKGRLEITEVADWGEPRKRRGQTFGTTSACELALDVAVLLTDEDGDARQVRLRLSVLLGVSFRACCTACECRDADLRACVQSDPVGRGVVAR